MGDIRPDPMNSRVSGIAMTVYRLVLGHHVRGKEGTDKQWPDGK